MAQTVRPLVILAALTAGMYVVAGQPQRAPKPGVPAVTAVAKPAPVIRSSDHRKVHKQSPKVAKRKWEPLPTIKPIPPIAKEEKRGRAPVKKQRVAQQRRPTTDECAQMSSFGSAAVKLGGRLRGYSDAQVNRALRECGL